MSSFVGIDPFAIVKTINLVGFRIDNIQVNLFNGASVRVILFDAPNSIHDIQNLNLTKEEYAGWASDDNYIINLICQKFGFSQLPTIIPVLGEPMELPTNSLPSETTDTTI